MVVVMLLLLMMLLLLGVGGWRWGWWWQCVLRRALVVLLLGGTRVRVVVCGGDLELKVGEIVARGCLGSQSSTRGAHGEHGGG